MKFEGKKKDENTKTGISSSGCEWKKSLRIPIGRDFQMFCLGFPLFPFVFMQGCEVREPT